jgi:CelD/BcsL family acetyltransferase involved in cellulose biosynthesis
MDYRIITTTKEFEAIRNDWERLEKNAPNITFFSTYEYCFNWWEAFHDHSDIELWIICINHNAEVVGIAPLMLMRQGKRFLEFTSVKFLANGDYKDFLVETIGIINIDSIYKTIFNAINENDHLWDDIQLTHISQKSLLALYLLKSEFNNHLKHLIENPFIDMSKFDNFNEFDSTNLPKKTKQYANRLKRHTNYTFHFTKNDLCEEFSKIHIDEKNHLQTRGKKHRSSLFENNHYRDFIKRLFINNQICSYYLFDNLRNQIIIFNYGSCMNNVFNSMTTAFNPDYENLGVGKIIYFEIFKNHFLNPNWTVFDTGTGRYPWKFEWATGFNFLYQLHYVKPSNKKLLLLQKFRKIRKAITN